jgi:uncharacterized membrane protein YeaQ/YmgE (transglycosylase-associated protein family)
VNPRRGDWNAFPDTLEAKRDQGLRVPFNSTYFLSLPSDCEVERPSASLAALSFVTLRTSHSSKAALVLRLWGWTALSADREFGRNHRTSQPRCVGPRRGFLFRQAKQPDGCTRKGGKTMSAETLLIILLVGLVAGWLAGQIVQGTGFGLVADILIGIVGAFIGSWMLPRLGIHIGSGIVPAIIGATVGALVLLLILRLLYRRGRW